jgi:hypothetical protein
MVQEGLGDGYLDRVCVVIARRGLSFGGARLPSSLRFKVLSFRFYVGGSIRNGVARGIED